MTEMFIPRVGAEAPGALSGAANIAAVEVFADPIQKAENAAGFIQPVAMENDPTELFPGDTGTLDVEARKVLVDLLRRRVLRADRNRERWRALLAHQGAIESRLHDMYVQLIVDHDRGLAYKQQIRSDVSEVPVLLRDEQFSRTETIVLAHLRAVYQREYRAGEISARVDAEELIDVSLSYLPDSQTNLAKQQKEISGAIKRLVTEGFIEEESEGRFLITPLVEVVLSVERLTELAEWLRAGAASNPGDDAVGKENTEYGTALQSDDDDEYYATPMDDTDSDED